jgi:hypothetical protein
MGHFLTASTCLNNILEVDMTQTGERKEDEVGRRVIPGSIFHRRTHIEGGE